MITEEEKNEDISFLNPVDGVITSSFGKRKNPVLGVWEFHNGIDIAAKEGTEAVAVCDGRIVEIRNSETLGNVLVYETIDGYRITYAHLKETIKEQGDFIKQGEVVALTGNTGLSTGPHLHYGVEYDGEYIDPYGFVDLDYTVEVREEYEARGETVE